MPKKVDHIVYAVKDLNKAIDAFEKKTGVRPVFGGYHSKQGTKNALINLGDECYLELLAVDHMNTDVNPPRWMGIDLLNSAKITRWAVKSDQLYEDSLIMKAFNDKMGTIKGGSRRMSDGSQLSWELIMPLAAPEVEVVPFMINWLFKENHPTVKLPDVCKLIGLYVMHPEPDKIQELFQQMDIDLSIIKGDEISLKAKIKSPLGIVEL